MIGSLEISSTQNSVSYFLIQSHVNSQAIRQTTDSLLLKTYKCLSSRLPLEWLNKFCFQESIACFIQRCKVFTFLQKTKWSGSSQQYPSPGTNFCLSYFSVVVIRHQNQRQLMETEFILTYCSTWIKVRCGMGGIAARIRHGTGEGS